MCSAPSVAGHARRGRTEREVAPLEFRDPEMSTEHPDFADEQAHIEHAYACLERTRRAAEQMNDLYEPDRGGTFQARVEREAVDEHVAAALARLDIRDAALVFGRIDLTAGEGGLPEHFHIGRLAVADDRSNPVVVDWRAPIAEPFYRATGRDPMGLARRRHFVVEGPRLLAIEDELFGDGHLGVGHDDGLGESVRELSTGLRGYGTLLAALSRARTGQLGDIVATIQAEQDEIIRSSRHGVLVVQGGPGTGKTVVALHRAAYLLYTHRFPLQDQGVLVIGPNRVFMRYIERVLPSLGEAGVETAVLADLIGVGRVSEREDDAVAAVKGRIEMCEVVANAIRDRQRPIRDEVVIPHGATYLRLSVANSRRIVRDARRRFRRHNAARRWVESELVAAMAPHLAGDSQRLESLRYALIELPEFRELVTRHWPLLTPAELLRDLFGSRALLHSACDGVLGVEDADLLLRERGDSLERYRWTDADVALVDEALALLGPLPRASGRIAEQDEVRTYGHIVVDEVQDMTPMQLRMVARRSLSGSMTIVGDLAQATGALAPSSWDDVLAHLPTHKEPRVVELTVGYRIPAQIMDLAARVLVEAAPLLEPPRSVRIGDHEPSIETVAGAEDLDARVVAEVRRLADLLEGGTIGVTCPASLVERFSAALRSAGVEHEVATGKRVSAPVVVVAVELVKGLEMDGVVVVEPTAIVEGSGGYRSLYVALTRATRHLVVVHHETLPHALRPAA